MSNHWGIYCRKCKTSSSRHFNHGDYICQSIIDCAPHIKAVNAQDRSGWVEIKFMGDHGNEVLNFALDHTSHHDQLIPIDEYGQKQGERPASDIRIRDIRIEDGLKLVAITGESLEETAIRILKEHLPGRVE